MSNLVSFAFGVKDGLPVGQFATCYVLACAVKDGLQLVVSQALLNVEDSWEDLGKYHFQLIQLVACLGRFSLA
ncbi:hypothetical protein U1Q18_011455, partial [Sarracenia purpurea var. burkii]